jgi:hypothetical protein
LNSIPRGIEITCTHGRLMWAFELQREKEKGGECMHSERTHLWMQVRHVVVLIDDQDDEFGVVQKRPNVVQLQKKVKQKP